MKSYIIIAALPLVLSSCAGIPVVTVLEDSIEVAQFVESEIEKEKAIPQILSK